jgi:hypothetical protein
MLRYYRKRERIGGRKEMGKGKRERESERARERENERCYWRKEMEESCSGKYK